MDLKVKILAAIAPFGIAGAVGFMYLQPSIQEFSDTSENLEKRKQENVELTSKLSDQDKVMREKRQLEASIDALRGSVPKKPDMEILNIDLEKMAIASGLDIVSLKLADKETLKKSGLDEPAPAATAGAALAAGKAQLASKVQAAAAPAKAAAAAIVAGAAAKGATAPGVVPDAGLAKSTVQIKLMGDYKGLMTFVHKLETYQRVVAVSEVHATIPKGSEKTKEAKATIDLPEEADIGDQDYQGDPSRMYLSLLLTTYYLP